jgi:hypothetical protein
LAAIFWTSGSACPSKSIFAGEVLELFALACDQLARFGFPPLALGDDVAVEPVDDLLG